MTTTGPALVTPDELAALSHPCPGQLDVDGLEHSAEQDAARDDAAGLDGTAGQ